MEMFRNIALFMTISGVTSSCPDALLNHVSLENQLTSDQSKAGYQYNTSYFNVQVDHFGFVNNDTFNMRYLISTTYWSSPGGPIFFYTGNEADITLFCNNTGFMWDIAPEFKAMLVFAEHRYYGESMPYGNDSFKDSEHLDYLTTEQALADFAELIHHLKTTMTGTSNSPVVAFGGSYGGMLAAWLRMKYPNVVVGSLASSASIWQFTGLTPCGDQAKIITKDFEDTSPICSKNIRRSWDVITKYGQEESGRRLLSKHLRLCDPVVSPSDVPPVIDWLSEIWFNLAMVDYPYEANLILPLPAYPIKEVCFHINGINATDEELLLEIGNALNVYFNYTGDARCFNNSKVDDARWSYQFCTEMVFPYCSDGVNDMFPVVPWDEAKLRGECQQNWNVTPRPHWITLQFGGKNIQAASNIIFSNGLLDPWSAGGVLQSVSESVIAIVIPDAAHHLDLRAKNKHDPLTITQARQLEKEIMQQWLEVYDRSNQGGNGLRENHNNRASSVWG